MNKEIISRQVCTDVRCERDCLEVKDRKERRWLVVNPRHFWKKTVLLSCCWFGMGKEKEKETEGGKLEGKPG